MAKKRKIVGKKLSEKTIGSSINSVRTSDRKFNLVIKNLILFIILSVISFALYSVINNVEIYANLFYILSLLFGFVSIAFLFVLLILFFRRLGLKNPAAFSGGG